MAERSDLERRIAEWEGQVAALRRGRFPVRGIRKRASRGDPADIGFFEENGLGPLCGPAPGRFKKTNVP